MHSNLSLKRVAGFFSWLQLRLTVGAAAFFKREMVFRARLHSSQVKPFVERSEERLEAAGPEVSTLHLLRQIAL